MVIELLNLVVVEDSITAITKHQLFSMYYALIRNLAI